MNNNAIDSNTTTPAVEPLRDPYGLYGIALLGLFLLPIFPLVSAPLGAAGKIPDTSPEGLALTAVCVGLGWVLVLVPGILWAEYNYLNAIKNDADHKWHDIDVQFRRRSALIPEYSTSVGRFLDHERATLTAVMDARKHSQSAESRQDKIGAEIALGGALHGLLAVVEAYPKITTHEGVAALQRELANTENLIASYRLAYNSVAKTYNTAVSRFPTRFIASHFGFKETSYA